MLTVCSSVKMIASRYERNFSSFDLECDLPYFWFFLLAQVFYLKLKIENSDQNIYFNIFHTILLLYEQH